MMGPAAFVIKSLQPGAGYAGLDANGAVFVTHDTSKIVMFVAVADARRFLHDVAPGGVRNWTVEPIG